MGAVLDCRSRFRPAANVRLRDRVAEQERALRLLGIPSREQEREELADVTTPGSAFDYTGDHEPTPPRSAA